MMANERFDVVVVGARCAGAATAFLLSRAGLKVLAIDRDAYGADTLSTHALMRGGVALLKQWGLLPAIVSAGTPPVRTVTFGYGPERVVVPIKADAVCDALYAPRRTTLDRTLADAAMSAGASVRFGARLEYLLADRQGRTRGICYRAADGATATVAADCVVGADGRTSTVARLAGARTVAQAHARSALVYGYFDGIRDEGYRWRFGDGAGSGVIPTNDGLHCVFASVAQHAFRRAFAEDQMAGLRRIAGRLDPEFGEELADARLVGGLRRFGGAPGHIREAAGPGWALVGDAGYFKDPITAHGLTDALRDAALLSEAILADAPAAFRAYAETRDRLSTPLFEATAEIASYEWSLTELKSLHERLNQAMKSDLEVLTGASCAPDLAA